MMPFFWLELILLGITLIVSAALALMVWSFGPKRMLNIAFALYAASSALWALLSIILRLALSLGLGNAQIILEGAILCFGLMGICLLLFTVRYLDLKTRRADQAVAVGIVALIILSVPLLNHQLVSNPRVGSNGIPISDNSMAAILIAVLLPGVYLIWSTALFWKERQRTQEPYLALSAVVLLVGFTLRAFNVQLPALTSASALSCCIMGYGILSRQLFNPMKEQTTALQHEIVERHRVEEALRESEAKFRNVFEQSSDAVVLCSEEGHILGWNHAAEQLTGLTSTEILGQFYWDVQFKLIPAERAAPATYEQLRSMMREALRTGQADWMRQLLEGEIHSPDGERRYFQQAVFPIQTAKGFMISSITRDITERKKAEEALQMFQYTIDRASDAVQWLNREGGFEYVNDQACRSLGYTREELLHLRLWDIDPIYPRERWDRNWESYQDGRRGGSENVETLHRRKDGSVFSVEVSSNHLWLGDRELHVAVVRDITERKRTEEALRRTQFVVDRAKDAIHWVDADGRLVYANDSICKSLGYTREELLAMTIFDIDPIFPKETWPDHWRKMSELGSYSFETIHKAKDGHTFPVEVSIDVMRFGGKEFHSIYARDITGRKQAEEALRESEERYRRLVEVSPVAMWINQDGIITYMNPAALRILGATDLQQVVGRTALDFVHPDYHAIVKERTAQMVDREYVAPLLEEKYVRVDGSVVDVEVTATPFMMVGGRAIQVLFQDITERKQTEQILHLRLRLMEFAATHSLAELLQKTLDEVGELTSSPIGFYHFVEADQRTLSLQAWSTRTLNEFCQAEGKGLHYPIDQAGVWTDCVRERRPVIHNDYPALPHRRGLPEGHAQVRRELVAPILRGDRIVAILGVGNKAQAYTEKDIEVVSYVADVAWEIVERKETEEEFVKLAKFPSENPYPVLRLDREGMVLYANKASLGLLADWNCAEGEWVPEFWREVITEALAKQAMKVVETQSGGRVYSVSVVPIVDANYVNLYGGDITERKQAESQREELIRELEAKNAELERFTYTVSHDLKAPLITMRGFLGFLEKDVRASDVERMQADMKRIVEATDKMQRLLSELLELSRIGRMMNPPEAVPFETIVREAIDLVRGRLEARGVRVDIAPDLPTVYGDRVRLVEVAQNLVDNSAKFMGSQAEPQITIGQQETDRDGKPIFFVRDNGIGIDPAYHDNVFGLFNKLDTQTEGTGIGLALVKRIVEVHGGRIWIESEGQSKGTTIFFTLATPPIKG